MSRLTRRSFLSGATAAAAAVGVSATPTFASAGSAKRVPLTRSHERAVVIGSGFGGGVSSLRLAQAGVDVLMLERGRWWRSGPNAETFPHAVTPDKRDLFYSVWPELGDNRIGLPVGLPPYVGLLEPVVGDGIVAVTPAGVGGGSLMYQGMTLQPAERVFNTWFPEQLDYARMHSVYYPRVSRMLQAKTAPDALINSSTYHPSRVFAENVRAAGYELSKVPMPIDWNYALDELNGAMKPSYTNGDCGLGVNNGGKHSVDTNYIDQGVKTGKVRVASQHNVTEIGQLPDGSWEIHVDRTDEGGNVLEKKIITTNALVLAAGSVNTSRLLVSAAARGTIKDLPDKVGEGYGTNGDQIYTWTDLKQDMGAVQGGPVIYGSFEWEDTHQPANTVIQASLPPIGVNLDGSQLLPSALVPGLSRLTDQISTPPLDAHSTMLVGYGVSSGRGRFTYNPATGKVDLSFPRGGDATLAARIKERITTVAGPQSTVLNTNDVVNSTWHSLGGACIGDVCDLEGRVLGKKGLYVLDGALMPGTTAACNPSMTIAAVAERALDRIVRTDVGTVI